MMKHILVMIGLFFLVIFQIHALEQKVMPLTLKVREEIVLRKTLVKIGLPDPGEKIAEAIFMVSKRKNLERHFIASLMFTESGFNPRAVSSKGYCGLMQIPYKIFDIDVNTLKGADIFNEKLAITKGDYRSAIILYKGWELTHPKGRLKADEVLRLTKKLKENA